MTGRSRALIAVAVTVLLTAIAVTYTVRAARGGLAAGASAAAWPPGARSATESAAGELTATKPDALAVRPGQLRYRITAPEATIGRIASVPVTGGGATQLVPGLTCARFYSAGGTSICLTAATGVLSSGDAVILDAGLREVRRVPLAGLPSRARVSASGRMVSWTVFVSGESYARSGFSTWTSILDVRTGELIANMEDIPLHRGGARYYAPDINYWGVTFAADDNRFYATVGTRGQTYLVEGDFARWEARTLRPNVECPSLSPDNTRLAFKKRVSSGAAMPWHLHVLDLRTGQETALAEPAAFDDQPAWLDDRTVAYARPGTGRGSSDIWSVPADGSGRPNRLVTGGSSPSPG